MRHSCLYASFIFTLPLQITLCTAGRDKQKGQAQAGQFCSQVMWCVWVSVSVKEVGRQHKSVSLLSTGYTSMPLPRHEWMVDRWGRWVSMCILAHIYIGAEKEILLPFCISVSKQVHSLSLCFVMCKEMKFTMWRKRNQKFWWKKSSRNWKATQISNHLMGGLGKPKVSL